MISAVSCLFAPRDKKGKRKAGKKGSKDESDTKSARQTSPPGANHDQENDDLVEAPPIPEEVS